MHLLPLDQKLPPARAGIRDAWLAVGQGAALCAARRISGMGGLCLSKEVDVVVLMGVEFVEPMPVS